MEEQQGQRRGRNSHGDGIIQRGIFANPRGPLPRYEK